jgi:trypsin
VKVRKKLLVTVMAAASLAVALPAHAIVGGSTVAEGKYPFMASLQDGDFHFCGGSVIAAQWVLTAAHCVDGAKPGDQDVVVGRTNLNDTKKGQRVRVSEVRVHPQYDGDHDAALLKLAQPVSVPSISLATAADNGLEAAGTPLTVAGWGTEVFGSPSGSDALKRAAVKAVTDARCSTSYGLQGFDPVTELCAEELLADSCQGDSGGPLFYEQGGRLVQVGIVSWGLGCAFPGFPGVYAEVNSPAVLNWITGTVGGGGQASTGGKGPKAKS